MTGDSTRQTSTTLPSTLVDELERLGSRVSLSAGEQLIGEGEHGKGIYLLHSGSVRMMVSPKPGEQLTLRTLGPGSFIGLSATLTCDHYCYTVKAEEPVEATFIAAATAQEFLRSRPDVCFQVIQLLGQEMSSLCAERAVANERNRKVTVIAPVPTT